MARKGIILDLDGNLVKSRVINEKIAKKEGEILFANKFPMNSEEEISNKWIEISNKNPYSDDHHERLVREVMGKTSPFYENLAREVQLCYEEKYFSNPDNWTGKIVEVLDKLKSNYLVGILTNGIIPKQERKLSYIPEITDLCDATHIATKEYAKPGRYAFDEICKLLGIEHEDSIMMGDKISADVFGGNRVGMQTIWYQRGDHQHKGPEYYEKNPTPIMRTYTQLKKLLIPTHTVRNFEDIEGICR